MAKNAKNHLDFQTVCSLTEMSINPILSETTLEFMLGQDEIFVRAKIQREFEYFDELNIIHNERSEF